VGRSPLITLDTSAVFASLDRSDPDHQRVVDELDADPGPLIVPMGILAELACLVEACLGAQAMDALLADLVSGAYVLDRGEDDLPRVRELMLQYSELPLGFSDASVVACAERRGGRVLTLEPGDFGVVAREGTLDVRP
jgi:predicted nucleic acid-binding protein